MTKQKLRTICLEKRNELTKEEIKEFSASIFLKVKPYLSMKTIALYSSYGNEVQTSLMIEEALKISDVFLPVTKGMGILNFYRIHKDTTYKKGIYGIKEPVSSQLINPNEIDVIIVPLVAFDSSKQRIGHGMAYYDRYLSLCENALKIGIAYECQKVKDVHPDAHDIPLDIIITEKNIYK